MAEKKDYWDKTSLVAPVILTLGIFLISHCYQKRQNQVEAEFKKIELLENLMPYLSTKDMMQNKVAILVLSRLGYDTIACELAVLINSPGTRDAIKTISNDTLLQVAKKEFYNKKWKEIKRVPVDSSTVKFLRNLDGKILLNVDGTPLTTEDGTPLATE